MSERVTLGGLIIWLLALLFFFYEFFLRIFLGTIASDLTHQLHLTAGQFSAIGAGYYITYGVMQIPVGLITDRLGARLTLSTASLTCVLGVFLLSISSEFWLAFVSRLLIGLGSSFGFVSLLVLILKWFPKHQFSFVAGLSIFLGAIGPLLAGAPLAWLYHALDGNWRIILVGAGFFGLGLSVILALFVRNKPKNDEEQVVRLEQKESASHLVGSLLKFGQVWWILGYSAMTYLVLSIFAAYFGTLFLQAREIPLTQAALIISMQWIGYAIGSPLLGKLSDRIKRRKPCLYLSALGGVVVSGLILFADLGPWMLMPLFILMGMCIAGQSLTYAMMLENVPSNLHSSALGVNNASSILSAALLPMMMGWVIQAGGGTFSLTALTAGLSFVPLFFFIAFLVAIVGLKETFCRQQNEVHTLHKYSDIF